MRDIFESTVDSLFGDLVTPALFRLCADGKWPGQLWDALEDAEFTCAMVPEALGGAASESSTLTQVLLAEDLAHADMGLAVRALAPLAVGLD